MASEGGCWWGNRQARGLLEEVGVDGVIILRRTLKKWAGRFGLHRLAQDKKRWRILWRKIFTFGFRKMWKVCSLAGNVAVNFSKIVIHRVISNSSSSSSSSSSTRAVAALSSQFLQICCDSHHNKLPCQLCAVLQYCTRLKVRPQISYGWRSILQRCAGRRKAPQSHPALTWQVQIVVNIVVIYQLRQRSWTDVYCISP